MPQRCGVVERALPLSAGGRDSGSLLCGPGPPPAPVTRRCLSFGSGCGGGCWRGPGLAVAVLAAPGARSGGATLEAERGRSGRAHLLEALVWPECSELSWV